MSSMKRIAAAVASCLLLSTTGCVFTQWVDRYFIGTVGGPPVYDNRIVTGLFLVPFAFVGDVATGPIQALILIIGGDDVMYSHAASPHQGHGMAALEPKKVSREALAQLEKERRRVHDAKAGPELVGVDARGQLRVIAVPQATMDRLLSDLDVSPGGAAAPLRGLPAK